MPGYAKLMLPICDTDQKTGAHIHGDCCYSIRVVDSMYHIYKEEML